MVRIGSNHMAHFSEQDIRAIIRNRVDTIKSGLNLLFVGVDWKRKGGADFLRLCELLKEHGVSFHGAIAGCKPVIPSSLQQDIDVYGFLDKGNNDDKEKIDSLFRKAHFFVLPTHAECAGIVFCESSAYGLPSLAYQTGGIGSLIKDDCTGKLFSLEETSMEKWATWIEEMINHQDRYEKMCYSAYRVAKKELFWDSIGKQIADIIRKGVNQ